MTYLIYDLYFKVSYRLKKRAQGPDAEDLKKMGEKFEEFALHLIEPLKRYPAEHLDCFYDVSDKAVYFCQRKVFYSLTCLIINNY
jgi:hypothetical protein